MNNISSSVCVHICSCSAYMSSCTSPSHFGLHFFNFYCRHFNLICPRDYWAALNYVHPLLFPGLPPAPRSTSLQYSGKFPPPSSIMKKVFMLSAVLAISLLYSLFLSSPPVLGFQTAGSTARATCFTIAFLCLTFLWLTGSTPRTIIVHPIILQSFFTVFWHRIARRRIELPALILFSTCIEFLHSHIIM